MVDARRESGDRPAVADPAGPEQRRTVTTAPPSGIITTPTARPRPGNVACHTVSPASSSLIACASASLPACCTSPTSSVSVPRLRAAHTRRSQPLSPLSCHLPTPVLGSKSAVIRRTWSAATTT